MNGICGREFSHRPTQLVACGQLDVMESVGLEIHSSRWLGLGSIEAAHSIRPKRACAHVTFNSATTSSAHTQTSGTAIFYHK